MNTKLLKKSCGAPSLFKGEPVFWVGGEYLHGRVSADTSVGHFGNNILQNVSIAVTTIADLRCKEGVELKEKEEDRR